MKKNDLVELLKTCIEEVLNELIEEDDIKTEVSTSGAAGPYNTPAAFRGNSESGKKKMRKNANQAGYKLVGDEDVADPI